jgi:AcrR family transcriptional regulator
MRTAYAHVAYGVLYWYSWVEVKSMSKVKKRVPAARPKSTYPLVWERVAAKGGTAGLKLRAIIREAVRLADSRGIAEVSMRNLASRLDAGTMSLYRYVRDKNDLWDLILDEAFGEVRVPRRVSKDWRRDVTKVMSSTRRVMLAHSWLAALTIERPTLGPNYLRWFEFLLAASATPNRSMKTRMRMIGVVLAFVLGSVGYEAAEKENRRRTGLSEAQKRKAATRYLSGVVAGGGLPHFNEYLRKAPRKSSDEEFRFGLRVILDRVADRRRS